MKRFIKFNKIRQFNDVVHDIGHHTRYIGLDDDLNPLYDGSLKLPTLTAIGTEKIHGTNGAICFSNPDGLWAQSNRKIITTDKGEDNAECAFFVYSKKDIWIELIRELAVEHSIDLDNKIISLYFEWAGGNIQGHSACSNMTKRAIIFQHFKVSPLIRDEEAEDGDDAFWLETGIIDSPSDDIYNICNFTSWSIDIDFNTPKLHINQMVDLVENNVEPNSPLGKEMGVDGNVGEGIVFTFMIDGKRFAWKVKGDKHTKSKVKKLQMVNSEKENLKIKFVNEFACTPSRLEQAYQEVFDTLNGGVGHISKTGDFLRWLINDVMSEEIAVMNEMGLTPKDVNSMISSVARLWMFEQFKK